MSPTPRLTCRGASSPSGCRPAPHGADPSPAPPLGDAQVQRRSVRLFLRAAPQAARSRATAWPLQVGFVRREVRTHQRFGAEDESGTQRSGAASGTADSPRLSQSQLGQVITFQPQSGHDTWSGQDPAGHVATRFAGCLQVGRARSGAGPATWRALRGPAVPAFQLALSTRGHGFHLNECFGEE